MVLVKVKDRLFSYFPLVTRC